jgi:hypothetical protein
VLKTENLAVHMRHRGADLKVHGTHARQAELALLMPEKLPPYFQIAPLLMPGLIVKIDIGRGDEVQDGRKRFAPSKPLRWKSIAQAWRPCLKINAAAGENLTDGWHDHGTVRLAGQPYCWLAALWIHVSGRQSPGYSWQVAGFTTAVAIAVRRRLRDEQLCAMLLPFSPRLQPICPTVG